MICISESAFEKMLRDPEYKAQVLDQIERDSTLDQDAELRRLNERRRREKALRDEEY